MSIKDEIKNDLDELFKINIELKQEVEEFKKGVEKLHKSHIEILEIMPYNKIIHLDNIALKIDKRMLEIRKLLLELEFLDFVEKKNENFYIRHIKLLNNYSEKE